MIAIIVVALVCGTVLAVGYRAERLLNARWTRAYSLESLRDDALSAAKAAERDIDARRVAVAEREITLKERIAADRPVAEPMPIDLVSRIGMWDDPYAQEAERQTLMSLYADLQSWDKVRQVLPTLAPDMRSEIVAPRDGLIQ